MNASIACRRSIRVLAVVVLAPILGLCLQAGEAMATSPLDPLSAKEIATAVQVMKAAPRLAGAAFPLISIAEPPKADVLAWTPGRPIARQAYAVVMAGKSTFEVLVDLEAKRLVSVVSDPASKRPSQSPRSNRSASC
jgi:Cu2+-containing amine oxidase